MTPQGNRTFVVSVRRSW